MTSGARSASRKPLDRNRGWRPPAIAAPRDPWRRREKIEDDERRRTRAVRVFD